MHGEMVAEIAGGEEGAGLPVISILFSQKDMYVKATAVHVRSAQRPADG